MNKFLLKILISMLFTGSCFSKEMKLSKPVKPAKVAKLESISFEDFNPEKLEKLILEEINQIRVESNLTPLSPEHSLEEAANSQAQSMKEQKTVTHFQADKTKYSLKERKQVFSIKSNYVSENLCDVYLHTPMLVSYNNQPVVVDSYTEASKALVNLWKNSPGHLENILDAKFKLTGIKVEMNASDKVIYAAQVFGS